MATLITLKNKKTGASQTFFSVDARDILSQPDCEWEFETRHPRGTPMQERMRPQLDVPKAEATEAPVEKPSETPKRVGRGGGPQEPASARSE